MDNNIIESHIPTFRINSPNNRKNYSKPLFTSKLVKYLDFIEKYPYPFDDYRYPLENKKYPLKNIPSDVEIEDSEREEFNHQVEKITRRMTISPAEQTLRKVLDTIYFWTGLNKFDVLREDSRLQLVFDNLAIMTHELISTAAQSDISNIEFTRLVINLIEISPLEQLRDIGIDYIVKVFQKNFNQPSFLTDYSIYDIKKMVKQVLKREKMRKYMFYKILDFLQPNDLPNVDDPVLFFVLIAEFLNMKTSDIPDIHLIINRLGEYLHFYLIKLRKDGSFISKDLMSIIHSLVNKKIGDFAHFEPYKWTINELLSSEDNGMTERNTSY